MRRTSTQNKKRPSGSILRSWEPLRYFLAVARQGGARQAAKHLGADHTTVARKIRALEDDLGKEIFERLPGDRLSLTPSGEDLRAGLEKIERDLFGLFLEVIGHAEDLSGTVRIGVSEGFGTFWLLPRLATFRESNQNLQIDLVFSSKTQDVLREIDIALRFYPPREDYVVRRQLGMIKCSFYGTDQYFAKYGDFTHIEDIGRHFFLLQMGQSSNPALQNLVDKIPEERVRLKASDSHAILSETRTGSGLALLPNYIERVEGYKGILRRASLEIGALLPVYLCYDERKRNIAKVRRVCEEIASRFNEDRREWFS